MAQRQFDKLTEDQVFTDAKSSSMPVTSIWFLSRTNPSSNG
jgi:hypothetical protein